MLSKPITQLPLPGSVLSHWPWRDDHDGRLCDIALVEALRADPRSFLHASTTPADIGRLISRDVGGPRWLHVGGEINGNKMCADVFEFELGGAKQEWVKRASMTEPIHDHAATLSADALPFVIGGRNSSGITSDTYEFVPRYSTWRPAPAIPEKRLLPSAVNINGDVFVCGGMTSTECVCFDMSVLRAGTMGWVPVTPMPICSCNFNCAAFSNTASPGVVAIGLSHSNHQISIQSHRYDCASDRWTRLGDLSPAVFGIRAQTLGDGTMYVSGGSLSMTARLDARIGLWQVVAPLPVRAHFLALCLFDSVTMVSMGGWCDDHSSSRCFSYDTRADRWQEEPRWKLPNPVHGHTVTRF